MKTRLKTHLLSILLVVLFHSCRSSGEFSIKNNLSRLLYYEAQVSNPRIPTSKRKWERMEEEKDYEVLQGLKAKSDDINNYIKKCFGSNPKENLKSDKIYGIRKIESQYNRLNTSAYVIYYFSGIKKNKTFGTFFQSDAVLYSSIDSVLDEMNIIESNLNTFKAKNRLTLNAQDTKYSYFNGLYFYTLEEGNQLKINLTSPFLKLGERKVFTLNCNCEENKCEHDPCNIFNNGDRIAFKDYETRDANEDKLYNSNSYSIYFYKENVIRFWAECQNNSIGLNSNELPLLLSSKDFATSSYENSTLSELSSESEKCTCHNSFKDRVVFQNTVDKFKMDINYLVDSVRNKNQVVSIFFDRNGRLYPTTGENLNCNELCENYASIDNYFINNLDTSYDSFEKTSIGFLSSYLNTLTDSANYKLTIITVGFNNNYEDSNSKLDSLIKLVSNFNNNQKNIFVKLFWDGTNNDSELNAALNFSLANGTSYSVGEKLRQILKVLNTDTINFISHSLGANLFCQATFNQISKVPSNLQSETNKFYKDNNNKDSLFGLAENKVYRMALVAPAIPGVNTFVDLWNDDINPTVKTTNKFQFLIGFNPDDEVLNKKFLSSSKFSSTTLGCDLNEKKQVLRLFEKDDNEPFHLKFYDFNFKNHEIEFYMKDNTYLEILKDLYSNNVLSNDKRN